ncbi:MAG: TPM domain-containing protein [Bacteroidetes bacterium]|nr:TPM domain-containing protein [Bacteroidota bacterium]
MKNIFIAAFLLFVTGFLYPQENGQSQIDNPSALTEYVTDETGTLDPSQLVTLRKRLRTFFDSTSTQVVVVMIPSLNGEPIEEAAIRIAAKNKIGRKGSNNGVLLLIAKNDRKLRIEVGYGLEGALTDALSKSIIANVISPQFKTGNYFEGIENGVNAIIAAVKGEYKAGNNQSQKSGTESAVGWIIFLFPFGLVVFIVVIVVFSVRRASRGGYVSGSGYSGYNSYSSSSYSSSDSYSSSSDSSSSSSDSGFSGGGGDFGGGGASGDW